MIVTVEVARQKACPVAMACDNIMAARTCKGDTCMAWVWRIPPPAFQRLKARNPDKQFGEPLGFCGMVGDVEHKIYPNYTPKEDDENE